MKPTLLYRLLIGVVLLSSCKKSEEEIVQETFPEAVMEPVIFNFTGTWSGLCGSVSKPSLDSFRLQYPNANLINCHLNQVGGLSDPLSNAYSQGLASFYNITVHPDSAYALPYLYFTYDAFLGGLNYSGIGYNALSSTELWVKENKPAAIALKLSPSINGTQLDLEVKYKATYAFTMPVYYSVVLTENNVTWPQTNDLSASPNLHSDVLRSYLKDYNGELFANSLKAGDSGSFSIATNLDGSWNQDNLYATVIIWYLDPVYGKMVHLGKRVKLK
jgi:hypothetical protein